MSNYFAENNTESTLSLFYKRGIYRDTLKAQGHGHVVDFNIGEKFLFGRAGRKFIPIEIRSNGYLNKISPKYLLKPSDNMQAMNFVVDVFNDFAKQFEKCAAIGKISPSDPFLSNIKVHKAYVDPNFRYDGYLEVYANALKTQFKQRNIDVVSFEEFVESLLNVIKDGALSYPLTKPAYIKSRLCPINCSGFAIEIADLSYENDDEKINDFVNSVNWDFYVNACNSYGFMIDLNVPWRIVADIDSEIMREYGKKYGVPTPDFVLLKQFKYVHFDYFRRFRQDLLKIYNKVRVPTIVKPVVCANDNIAKEYITPKSYQLSELKEKFSASYFLKKYFQIRFFEEESRFSNQEQQRLIHECLEAQQSLGDASALTVFEQILNKPFDYLGSLSYINKQVKALAAQAENS